MNNELKTFIGCEELEIQKRDGTTQAVFVRELPIRLIPKFLQLQDDESALVELYCDQEPGWADSLTIASHEAVHEKGGALNFPVLERWIERKQRSVAQLQPALAPLQALLGSAPSSPSGADGNPPKSST